jgi:hypothetical protein
VWQADLIAGRGENAAHLLHEQSFSLSFVPSDFESILRFPKVIHGAAPKSVCKPGSGSRASCPLSGSKQARSASRRIEASVRLTPEGSGSGSPSSPSGDPFRRSRRHHKTPAPRSNGSGADASGGLAGPSSQSAKRDLAGPEITTMSMSGLIPRRSQRAMPPTEPHPRYRRGDNTAHARSAGGHSDDAIACFAEGAQMRKPRRVMRRRPGRPGSKRRAPSPSWPSARLPAIGRPG